MPKSANKPANTIAFALAALLVAPLPVAVAQERCTGTLCDAYYGSAAPEPTAPAGATPLTVPSGGILGFFSGSKPDPAAPAGSPGAAPAKAPMVAVEGGGLLGMMKGAPAERCSGTFCDLYYGGPPPEKPEPQQAATGVPPRDAQGLDQGIDRSPPPRSRNRRAVADEGGVSYAPRLVEKPQCVAPPGDPWKCYRK